MRLDTARRFALSLPETSEELPDAYEQIVWGKQVKSDWMRVTLAHADRDIVCELLEEGCRRKAPKRLLAAHDAATPRG